MLKFRPEKEDWKRSLETFNRTGGSGFAWEVLLCVVSLLAIGAVMVYSATTMFADNARYNVEADFFFWKHLVSMLIACFAGWIAYLIPMRYWYRWAPWIFGLALILLIAVLIPGVGKVVNGSRRWIGLGVMNLQVSEVMKVVALIMAAWYTVKRLDYRHSFQKGFFPIASLMFVKFAFYFFFRVAAADYMGDCLDFEVFHYGRAYGCFIYPVADHTPVKCSVRGLDILVFISVTCYVYILRTEFHKWGDAIQKFVFCDTSQRGNYFK